MQISSLTGMSFPILQNRHTFICSVRDHSMKIFLLLSSSSRDRSLNGSSRGGRGGLGRTWTRGLLGEGVAGRVEQLGLCLPTSDDFLVSKSRLYDKRSYPLKDKICIRKSNAILCRNCPALIHLFHLIINCAN